MITKRTIFTTVLFASLGIIVSNLPITKTVVAQSSGSSSPYKLPYPAGVTYQVSRGNAKENGQGTGHPSNGSSVYAYDFAMSEGSDVVAARGGTVIGLNQSSTVGGCSYDLWTKANYVVIDHGGGESTIYAHLKPNSVVVKVGNQVQQGQKIAQSGKTGYTCGANGGPGPHLHYAVQKTPSPSSNPGNIQHYWTASKPSSFSDPDVLRQNSNGIPTGGKSYTSSNGIPSNNSDTFKQRISSSIRVTQQSVNLNVCASNLPNQTVYVQMWRDAAYGYPAKEWNVSKVATSTCMDFLDLEGPRDSFSGVTYYTVASLTPIPNGEAAKKRTSCWGTTGGKYLCDAGRR
jgi:murein DD-endopeptidase MepM/ murein hydrolase activator NlpD